MHTRSSQLLHELLFTSETFDMLSMREYDPSQVGEPLLGDSPGFGHGQYGE